jgi:hypothetical protein
MPQGRMCTLAGGAHAGTLAVLTFLLLTNGGVVCFLVVPNFCIFAGGRCTGGSADGDDGALEEDSDAVSDRGRLSSDVYSSSMMAPRHKWIILG